MLMAMILSCEFVQQSIAAQNVHEQHSFAFFGVNWVSRDTTANAYKKEKFCPDVVV
jgi:hypothetical protein